MTAKKNPRGPSLFLSDRALSDLLEIEHYTSATWGKSVASKYMLKFEKAFLLLRENSNVARPNADLGTDLLFYRVEKHLLVCLRLKTGIAVLTVAHASRDLESLLGEIAPTLRAEAIHLAKKIKDGR